MSALLGNSIVLFSLLVLIPLFFLKRMRDSKKWQAIATPLASIIGSGFLLSAPLVVLTTGKWAVLAMFAIVTIAYFLGSALRFNILYFEPYLLKGKGAKRLVLLENLSRPILGIAYMISVAFYLKFLSIFALKGLGVHSEWVANSLTTAVLLFIGFAGCYRGLNFLEILEKYAVSFKLAIIGALLISFYTFNLFEFESGRWFLLKHPPISMWDASRQLLGILIIVQGFETSRYMGQLYSAEVRVKTMRYAQLISGFIYVAFIASSMILFNNIHRISETAIIDLCKIVAPILPFFLIVAAIMSQFSAAIADSIGSSGLISETTRKVISIKQGIVITTIVAIGLVWLTNIFEIIVIASKAFAIYYALQCLIAAKLAYQETKRFKAIGFILLFFLMLLVVFLGTPVA